MKRILDAKYSKADIKTIAESSTHLDPQIRSLGIDIHGSDMTIHWDDAAIPWRDIDSTAKDVFVPS